MSVKYDAMVVGAGPAGSTAARELAGAGAKVLLLDRAKFPRDKPCGGGITFRADEASGIDLTSVTERELVGADGVNGQASQMLGLEPASECAVAFEANYPADDAMMERWKQVIALDLAGIPGGYGWVFPRADHLNIGVGGWKYVGPTLRA